MHTLHLSQQVTEFAIVDLYTIVQIQCDALVGVVAEFFVKGSEFSLLFM
jgi:hypothetical protein